MIFTLFLLFPAHDSLAEVMLTNTKIVKIDQNWNISAHYKRKISLKNSTDIEKYTRIRLPKPFSFRTIRDAKAVAKMNTGEPISAARHKNQLVLEGLRAPATLVVEFTIVTHYPAMGGLFNDAFHGGEAMENYYKVTFPSPGDYQWVVQQGGLRESIRSAHGSVFEWNSPGDDGPGIVKISTAGKWDRIQAHYTELYENILEQDLFLSDMSPKVGQWRQETSDIMRRRVFQYIHEKVRYRSHLEKGAPLTPARPDDVLKRGWGDCKDLSVLTVKLLRLLGFEAYPVLCAPTDKVDRHWPDPFVFNHAIVKLVVDGEARYYDPSRGKKRVPQSVIESIYMLPLTEPGS